MIKRGGSAVMAKEELPECPVATAVSLIGGKWKLLIIRNLRERPWRFNELRRDLEGISQKVLTDSLRRWRTMGWSFATTMVRILPALSMASPNSVGR